MSRRPREVFSSWQLHLLAELKSMAKSSPHELRITKNPRLVQDDMATVSISLRTGGISRIASGLELQDQEEFELRIPPRIFSLPDIDVGHARFLGFPHVLQGHRICIFLDPSREWQPFLGMAGLLNRLWDWLENAAGAKFDAKTSLYHAVGGVLHQTPGTPTVVVREAVSTGQHRVANIIKRSEHRYDLTYVAGAPGYRLPVFVLASDLPYGADRSLAGLLMAMDDPYLDQLNGRTPRIAPQSSAFVSALSACAVRNPDGTEQYFILGVPHPSGGPPHLLCGRLPSQIADSLRKRARDNGTIIAVDTKNVDGQIPVEWCKVSDERQEVTTRRDKGRPVNGFVGKKVQIWGCGGIGSWIAEFVARAGASQITLCDPGVITGGLLVRQNYVEEDIGRIKAEALSERLRRIREDIVVNVADGQIPEGNAAFREADVIIDATISNLITQVLDAFSTDSERTATIAQVATDARSGTLGLLSVCAPLALLTPSEIDHNAGEIVRASTDLEIYHKLWQEPAQGDELVPTRGCSVPTFHGSAADLAAVAAVLTSLLGNHLRGHGTETSSGTHVVSLPHSGGMRPHYFLPATADAETPTLQ